MKSKLTQRDERFKNNKVNEIILEGSEKQYPITNLDRVGKEEIQ